MSDSDESGVTYMEVSSPFESLSDIGSLRANDHESLELPGMTEDPYVEASFQATPSPDYVPGLEEPEQAPPSPDYVLGQSILMMRLLDGTQRRRTMRTPRRNLVDYSAKWRDDGDDRMSIGGDEDNDVDLEGCEDEGGGRAPTNAESVVVALPNL
ncbi:hypothetical protein Tco_0524177 [Tanacetum coccineum]